MPHNQFSAKKRLYLLVPGGKDVVAGGAVFFNITGNGTLTIKNLNKDSSAYGILTLQITS